MTRRHKSSGAGCATIIMIFCLVALGNQALTHPLLGFILATLIISACIYNFLLWWGHRQQRLGRLPIPASTPPQKPDDLTRARTKIVQAIANHAQPPAVYAAPEHRNNEDRLAHDPEYARMMADKDARDRAWRASKPTFDPDLSNQNAATAFEYVKTAPGRIILYQAWQGGQTRQSSRFDIVIRYQGSDGEITIRQITVGAVRAVWHHDNTITPILFLGYCHLRHGERSFYLRDVAAAADPSTGQKIDNLERFLFDNAGYRDRKLAAPTPLY